MAFTAGSLYGKFEGSTALNNSQSAFTGSNLNNPNAVPAIDLFQILAPGGACLLQVTAAYAVNTNVAAGSFSSSTVVATVQMTSPQYNGLVNKTGSTAAQICAAAFPLNYGAQQLDLIQVEADLQSGAPGQTNNIAGGGAVAWRLDYAGAAHTS
jgi:hypothetical protein